MPESLRWQPTSAWGPIATPSRGGAAGGEPGVRVDLEDAAHMLSIVARSGRREDLARALAEGLGIDLPLPGRLAKGSAGDLIWSGPDHWLAVTREAMPTALRQEIEGVAATTDQSSARALLHISGAAARDALAKGFAIDLHPGVFQAGHTAVTRVAHVSVQIWQREAGRYTIAVPRSFASSFWSWLIVASAAYGYEVATVVSFPRLQKVGPRSGAG